MEHRTPKSGTDTKKLKDSRRKKHTFKGYTPKMDSIKL